MKKIEIIPHTSQHNFDKNIDLQTPKFKKHLFGCHCKTCDAFLTEIESQYFF